MCDVMSAFILLVMFVAFNGLQALQITQLSVPRWIENGTQESVTLDCVYNLTDKDDHLVVKWFHNDDPKPIYQWIPELGSRLVSEKLQGHTDMNSTIVPSTNFTEYRSLRILKPTTQLSGKYSCHVTSFNGLDTAEKEMTIYAPAKFLRFNYTKSTSNRAKFGCEVGRVYPVPDVDVFQTSPGATEHTVITDTETEVVEQEDSYKVSVSYEIEDSELSPDGATRFDCFVNFPGTNYQRLSSINYYPDAHPDVAVGNHQSPDGSSSISSCFGLILLNATLLFVGINGLFMRQF
ncbi:uncharacterized protein LOC143231671 isoform X4 [Tachypleus tridentatus]|uniref:uncharacterized protein LOC143231671 isoform X4 n=1 Tax=Tachypleus tridentatus TaxID=6853 RepID=UPI003FD5E50C